MDVTALLDDTVKNIDKLGHQTERVVILLETVYCLLSVQPISIQTHQPFINVIW